MKSLYVLLGLLAISVLIVNPGHAFAVNHANYLWGANGLTSATGATGARMTSTIESLSTDHTFPNTNEDHNYHIDGYTTTTGHNWDYIIGWQVGSGNPTSAHPFAEVWKDGVRQYNWQGTKTYTDGTQQYFAFHKPGTTVSFYDSTSSSSVLTQYNTGNTDTYDAQNTSTLAEKVCPGGCAASSLGVSPTVYWPVVIEYTKSPVYSTSTWTAMGSANADYLLSGPLETEANSYSIMCHPLTMQGHIQDNTLSTNTMNTFDSSSVTCTSYTANVW